MAISKLKASHLILELKAKLSSSDYKVIKCYEAQLAKEAMPYDLNILLEERKKYRLDIESLEKIIKESK